MIEYELNPDLNSIDWEKVSELFQLVNWVKGIQKKLKALLKLVL